MILYDTELCCTVHSRKDDLFESQSLELELENCKSKNKQPKELHEFASDCAPDTV